MTIKGLDQLHILHVYIYISLNGFDQLHKITCPYMDQLHFFIEISRSVGNIPKE